MITVYCPLPKHNNIHTISLPIGKHITLYNLQYGSTAAVRMGIHFSIKIAIVIKSPCVYHLWLETGQMLHCRGLVLLSDHHLHLSAAATEQNRIQYQQNKITTNVSVMWRSVAGRRGCGCFTSQEKRHR